MKKVYLGIIVIISINWACKNNQTKPIVHTPTNVDSIIGLMTLEEKIGMIHASSSFTSGGVPRLGIPELVMSDGPHGVRHEHGRDWTADETTKDSATYLPTGIALGATWNADLGYEYGRVLGSETAERQKDLILGPGINIIRSPLNGRNFEYLSEDPFLTAQMAVGYIRGVQDQGVGVCAKHYVANSQETNRHHINVRVSERALREIYFPAYKAAVQYGGAVSIMSAYNQVNDTFCSSHNFLLQDVLRNEWGFTGIVISDWQAVQETEATLKHGVDIEMGTDLGMLPNPDYSKFFLADAATEMIKKGQLPESLVDTKVRNILHTMHKINVFGKRPEGKRNTAEHQQIALKVAEEGIVLLKNENILPIKPSIKTIAVIGDNAVAKHAEKGGSSQVKALYEVSPLDGIKKLAGDKYIVKYAQGYEVTRENTANQKLITQAAEIAKTADLVIFIGGWIHGFDDAQWGEGTFDAEAKDKQNLDLMFGQEELLEALLQANSNVVSVIFGGSSVKFGNWSEKSRAILQAWYPGMEGGNALANILFGKTNPSGKLPVSFAENHTNYPDHVLGEFPGDDSTVVFKDDIFVGYRYFDTFEKPVIFPFGHGLSYTKFEFGKIRLDKTIFSKDEPVKFSIEIENNGEVDGAEVVQIYISDHKSEIERPMQELKAFQKVFVNAGTQKTLHFELDSSAFAYFNPQSRTWTVEPGKFEIRAGASSRDIRQKMLIEIK